MKSSYFITRISDMMIINRIRITKQNVCSDHIRVTNAGRRFTNVECTQTLLDETEQKYLHISANS